MDSGFPRGVKAPCWHTILLLQSLVCYTFCDRGWLKGVGRWKNKHFEVAAGQADFESTRFRNSGFTHTKSACPGVGDAAYFFCITGGARGISHSRLPSRGTSASCDAPCCRSNAFCSLVYPFSACSKLVLHLSLQNHSFSSSAM